MNDYKKQLMKLLKLHNDMVEEVIYSRYFLLLSKVEEKQKANIEKRRLTNKIHKAITAHKEQLKYINNLLK
jgi:DNA-directed RNA polymerase beta' subunit